MKSIPLFLVLTLTLAWGYTSWYWYTCNIKGACESSAVVESVADPIVQTIEDSDPVGVINEREQETSREDVQQLSRDDVLVGNAVIPQAPVEEEIVEEETLVTEGEVQDDENEDTGSGGIIEEEAINIEIVKPGDLCISPLVGPISIAGSNNSVEVEKLENFLIANAYLSASDGTFGNTDFEAVKQLQLDYKEQMLDPWGIDAPTGYVGSTTVATINSIGCKN